MVGLSASGNNMLCIKKLLCMKIPSALLHENMCYVEELLRACQRLNVTVSSRRVADMLLWSTPFIRKARPLPRTETPSHRRFGCVEWRADWPDISCCRMGSPDPVLHPFSLDNPSHLGRFGPAPGPWSGSARATARCTRVPELGESRPVCPL